MTKYKTQYKTHHNWDDVNKSMIDNGPYDSLAAAAKDHDIATSTVYSAYRRGDLEYERIINTANEAEAVDFNVKGNDAVLKFKTGEPMSAEDVMDLAGVDEDEWKIEDYEITLWQVGAKSVVKDLTYEHGKATGIIKSDGGLTKEYLYRIRVKLTRRVRIAVKAAIQPIEMARRPYVQLPLRKEATGTTTLFIADPHFGFVRGDYGLHAIHHRQFLASLLTIAQEVQPTRVIWNGDILDLADFSSFATSPDQLHHTQLAGIELAWVLEKFGSSTERQIILEGNHDIRLSKALIKNMTAAYGLRPVHDIGGEDLMSVPRFLGLDRIGVDWIGGYPDSRLKVGGATFEHGNVVRKGSGRTASSIIDGLASSRFFGHIHRMELAQRYVPDLGHNIYAGSPGCACRWQFAPGATSESNWQLGAFLITHSGIRVSSVEPITRQPKRGTFFRGESYSDWDYLPLFLDSCPKPFNNQY